MRKDYEITTRNHRNYFLICLGRFLSGCKEQTEDKPENQAPIVYCSANPTNELASLTVYVEGSGSDSDGTITSYWWYFRGGKNSVELNPIYTFESFGTYNVTLPVEDTGGKDSDTETFTITVSGIPIKEKILDR